MGVGREGCVGVGREDCVGVGREDCVGVAKSGRLTTPPPTLGAPRGQRCSL